MESDNGKEDIDPGNATKEVDSDKIASAQAPVSSLLFPLLIRLAVGNSQRKDNSFIAIESLNSLQSHTGRSDVNAH